jgi:hypothetical protein
MSNILERVAQVKQQKYNNTEHSDSRLLTITPTMSNHLETKRYNYGLEAIDMTYEEAL